MVKYHLMKKYAKYILHVHTCCIYFYIVCASTFTYESIFVNVRMLQSLYGNDQPQI